jgi:glycogen(starch) synthase
VRVLHLTTEFPPVIYGGLGTATGGLVKALVKASVDVAVLLIGPTAGSSYGEFKPLFGTAGTRRRRSGGVTIFEVSWFQDLDIITRIVASWRAEVVHLHSFWLWPIAQAIRQRLGTPLVYTVHSLDRAEYEIGAGPPQCVGQWGQQEAVIYGADRIISLTSNERLLLMDYCPGVCEQIRVIGNGIDDIAEAKRRRRSDEHAPVVLFSGRFVDRKGIHELMDAIAIVLVEAPTARFVLAGGHRDCSAADMEAWLLPPHLHHHRERITFTGWLTSRQMDEYYRSSDILVVPSWYEPFGMVVLEGMIHGLAVAASAVGGPAEILQDGITGILFPPRDASALARAILRLTNDAPLRDRIARAGAWDVRRNWLWSRIVEKMRGVYEEIISHPGGSGSYHMGRRVWK